MKGLKKPISEKWRGLKVYCPKCRCTVGDICKQTLKKIENCPNRDQHKYQYVLHKPGTKHGRIMRLLNTRELSVAIEQAREIKKEYLEVQNNISVDHRRINKENEWKNPTLPKLIEWYKQWLNKADDITLLERNRTPDHIENILKGFKEAEKVWRRSGIDFNKMTLADINIDRVRDLFNYYHRERKLKSRTINKYIGYFKTFINRGSEELNIDVRNYFEKYKQLPVTYEPNAISISLYHRLIDTINNPSSNKSGKVGNDYRFYYRDYLVPAIQLGLHTGRRREELINLRYCDEFEDDGFRYFRIEDYKVNRIQNRTSDENKKFIIIPVTKGLQRILDEFGYDKYKGSDKYLIAPELPRRRNRRMSDIITRGFTHYYKQIEPDGKLSFGSLRKKYISELAKLLGNEAKLVSHHSNNKVLDDHYKDKKLLLKAAVELDPEELDKNRTEELIKIRNTKENNHESSLEK